MNASDTTKHIQGQLVLKPKQLLFHFLYTFCTYSFKNRLEEEARVEVVWGLSPEAAPCEWGFEHFQEQLGPLQNCLLMTWKEWPLHCHIMECSQETIDSDTHLIYYDGFWTAFTFPLEKYISDQNHTAYHFGENSLRFGVYASSQGRQNYLTFFYLP